MKDLDSYLNAEQVEQLRDFETPPPPPKRTRRKGSLRVASIIKLLHAQGQTTFTVWDVLSRLKKLDLIDNLWDFKSDEGALKTLGDIAGMHGLKLTSKVMSREIHGVKKPVRVYEIPEGGITEAYLEEHLITLVDDPSQVDPAPMTAGTIIDDVAEAEAVLDA